VELLVRGLTNRQIAAALSVSENTVEYHLRHAYGKFGVRGRTQVLARFFQETVWPDLERAGTVEQ
jgi:DNA-binding CsgD family transcriptional regulator